MFSESKLDKLIKFSKALFLVSAILTLLGMLWMSLHVKFVAKGFTVALIIFIADFVLAWSFALEGLFFDAKILKQKWKNGLSPILAGAIIVYLIGNWSSLINEAYTALPFVTILTLIFLFLALIGSLIHAGITTYFLAKALKNSEISCDELVEEQKVIVISKGDWKERFKRWWDNFFTHFTIGSKGYYILFLGILAIFYFAVALFNNQFTIPLGGDYTQQTIPFYTNGYDDWWHFFKTGEFPLWDSNTNLGVNNIGANAFYYVLNPFFLPILLCPRPYIAQGIAVLMIGKLILAAFTMRAYLKYVGVKEKTALFFGLAYAFCGWNTYYLWFNHFMEVTVVFPLVFLGIEKILKEKRPFLLAGALALMGFTNFFFLVTTCIVGVIYAGFRFFQLIKTWKKIDFLIIPVLGILGFAFGLMISATVLLPGVMMSMQSDRVTRATYLDNLKTAFSTQNWKIFFDYVLKWETQSESYTYKKLYPLATFFFPVLSNRSSPIFATSSYDNTISSLFLYTPVMLLLLPSIIRSITKRKVSHFIALGLIVFAIFTPFSYHFLHGFTNEYGRWQIFVTLILITYTAKNFDAREEMPIWYFDLSVFVLILGAYLTYKAAFPYQLGPRFGPLEEREYIVFYQFTALLVVYLIYRFAKASPHLKKYLLLFTSFEVILMGNITMIGHGTISFQNSVGGGIGRVREETEIVKGINAGDQSFFRIFSSSSYRGNDNIGMRENFNGLGAFHSLYNFKLMNFNSFSHVNYNYNGWSMGIQEKRYNLDTFLGVKYYIVDVNETKIFYVNDKKEITKVIAAPYDNIPFGYTLRDELSTARYRVYENKRFIELGSSYTTLMSHNYYYETETGEELKRSRFYRNYAEEPVINEEKYLRYAILDEKDLQEVLETYPEFNQKEYTYSIADHSYLASSTLNSQTYHCNSGFPYDQIGTIQTNPGCEIVATGKLSAYKTGVIYTKKDGTNFTNGPAHLVFKLRTTDYVRIFLFDQDENIITFDDHNNINSPFKYMRGFYTPVAVKSILVVPKARDIEHLANAPVIYIQPEEGTIAQYNQLKANGFINVSHSYNHYHFQTNYDKTRFAVTNIPYDEGWSVRIKDGDEELEKPKVYLTQGGFVGFVVPKGNLQIELNYFTPHLKTGLTLGISAFLLWGGSFALVYFLYDRKKKAPPLVQAEEALND
ncbi:MAG: YfhO family protein [Bacilli bacterium]